MKNTILIIIGVVLLIVGYTVGKSTTTKRVSYERGTTVTDTIERLVPYAVEVPTTYVLPTRVDTLLLSGDSILIVEHADTARIIAEFVAINKYRQVLFDNDTIGRLEIGSSVQYNRLNSLSYSFTPMVKVVEREAYRLIPFVSFGVSSFQNISIGGGVFY